MTERLSSGPSHDRPSEQPRSAEPDTTQEVQDASVDGDGRTDRRSGISFKHVLECIALVITIVAGVIGLYGTRESPPPPVATNLPIEASPAQSPSSTAPRSERLAASAEGPATEAATGNPATWTASTTGGANGLPVRTASMPSRSATATPVSIADRSVSKLALSQTTAAIKDVLDRGLPSLFRASVSRTQAIDPDVPFGGGFTSFSWHSSTSADANGVAVDVIVSINPVAYATLYAELMPLLDREAMLLASVDESPTPSAAAIPLVVADHAGQPYFDFADVAGPDALQMIDRVAGKKRRRGETIAAELFVMIDPIAPHQASAEPSAEWATGRTLPARIWRISPGTGAVLAAAFERTAAMRLQIDLEDTAGTVLATRTVPLAQPARRTERFELAASPLVPLGYGWGLEQHRFSVEPSLRDYGRRDSVAGQVFGLLPGQLGPAVRGSLKQAKSDRGFRSATSYRQALPIDDATAVGQVSTKILP